MFILSFTIPEFQKERVRTLIIITSILAMLDIALLEGMYVYSIGLQKKSKMSDFFKSVIASLVCFILGAIVAATATVASSVLLAVMIFGRFVITMVDLCCKDSC